MRLSELIKELEEAREKYGDGINVEIHDSNYSSFSNRMLGNIFADENGVEIWID